MILDTIKRGVAKGLLHVAAWVIGGLVTGLIFGHSDSRLAYSLLSGWWCALYCGSLFRVPTAAILPATIVYLMARIGESILGGRLLSHDPPALLSSGFVFASVLGWLVFVSPILLNELVRVGHGRR